MIVEGGRDELESRGDQSMSLWNVVAKGSFGSSRIQGTKGGFCDGGRAGTSTCTRAMTGDDGGG